MLDDTQQQSLVTRLNRIEGQIRGIRRMVQEPRLCIEILQQLAADFDDDRRLHSSPSFSSNPHITLKFCTADPAAPLIRLSIVDTISARPVSSAVRWRL